MGESFEQIGEDVVRETVQVPKDIVGKALETAGLGAGKSSGKKKQAQQQMPPGTPEVAQAPEPSDEIKRAVARAALEALSGKPQKKEPSVWERIQQEEEQKKEMEKKRKEAQRMASVPQVSSKRKRGDLFGVKAKKTATETGGNKRQD